MGRLAPWRHGRNGPFQKGGGVDNEVRGWIVGFVEFVGKGVAIDLLGDIGLPPNYTKSDKDTATWANNGISAIVTAIEERLQMEWNNMTKLNTSIQPYSRVELANLHVPPATDRSGQLSLVLATHVSVDKIHDPVPILLDFWRGPVSVAICINAGDQISMLLDVLQNFSPKEQTRLLVIGHGDPFIAKRRALLK